MFEEYLPRTEEYRISNEYAGIYRSRLYDDGREEQIRIVAPDDYPYPTGIAGTQFTRRVRHVQAFVNNISAPKTLDELILVVEEDDCFNVEAVINYDDLVWTVPRWAKPGDIVFFMHSKTSNSSLTAIRTQLNKQKDLYSTDQFNKYMEWINRGLLLHKKYGGKIYAVAMVCGAPEIMDYDPDNLYHWGSRIYADIDHIVPLENPVDISEFNDFLYISRVSGVTPVFGGIFNRLKETIAKKNKIPEYLEYADATPLPLAKINLDNWMTLSNEYRRAFMLESHFRHYYVDYLLKAISDRRKIYSECICKKSNMANSFVDNVIYINKKYLPIEVKLSVASQVNIKAQVRKYCYDDVVVLDNKKNVTAEAAQFHEGKCLIIDTDEVYMFDFNTDSISPVISLDDVNSNEKIIALKRDIESLLTA